jgi:hypothetical protein
LLFAKTFWTFPREYSPLRRVKKVERTLWPMKSGITSSDEVESYFEDEFYVDAGDEEIAAL